MSALVLRFILSVQTLGFYCYVNLRKHEESKMAKNQQGKGGFADNPKLASEAGKKGGQASKGGNQKSGQKS